MIRIAVGGFLHETNTFAPTKAAYDDFAHRMVRDSELLKVMRNINTGLAGFVEAAEARGWQLAPTTACAATPSAHVTEDAFERIVGMILEGLASAGRIDGVYLDLHGAMVTEHLDDGEGEILARVRKLVGRECPRW
jgi:microcystin degradation protein MlrC